MTSPIWCYTWFDRERPFSLNYDGKYYINENIAVRCDIEQNIINSGHKKFLNLKKVYGSLYWNNYQWLQRVELM